MAIPSQALFKEGVETRRRGARSAQGIVQTIKKIIEQLEKRIF